MDANVLISMIGSLGFPIVACIFIALFFNKTHENYRADIKEMQATHKAETDKMTEALNNNTLALQKLIDKMEGDKDDK